MMWCNITTCPELYFDSLAVVIFILVGISVGIWMIAKGISNFIKGKLS